MISSFGETVRALRLERNLTQEQLSGALNISPQAVSKWERGQALPDLTLIPALARAAAKPHDKRRKERHGIFSEQTARFFKKSLDKRIILHFSLLSPV